MSGRGGSETSARYERLAEKTGMRPAVVWSQTGRIQLGHEVSVAITLNMEMGNFGSIGSWPVTLRLLPCPW